MSMLAFCLGIVTGFGAVVFRMLIGTIHNAAFLGRLSPLYDASQFTPASPWGAGVILVPVVGGVAVTWLVSRFAPAAKGHGVPEVMDAIYFGGGVIRPVVAVVKSLASAIAIGTGAAVGREGPIIQIGSALGSTLGQWLRMPASQRIILVASGAGAGIASTFNTPIGGVLFATELMMPEISVGTFLPVALATGTATFVGRLFFGGAMMYLLMRYAGHYYVEGVGYATIQATLNAQLQGGLFLLLLALCKMVATSVSFGSGSSGGVFSPSLFIGATLGAAMASLFHLLVPAAPVSLTAFAMVGMGALVAGGTGAAMTAVAMIFEMTRDYDIVLPMILAVAFSIGTRRLLSRETIYTMKLVRRGHVIPYALHANMFLVQSAAAIMEADILVLDAQVPFRDLLDRMGGAPFRHIVVTKAGMLYGVLRINTGLRRAVSHDNPTVTIGQLAHRNFIVVKRSDAAFEVIGELRQRRAVMAVVVADSAVDGVFDVSGVIAKEHIADAVARSIDIFQRRVRGRTFTSTQTVRVNDASYAVHGRGLKVSDREAEN